MQTVGTAERPSNTSPKTGCLQKRQQPIGRIQTKNMPLAKRMREMSNTLIKQGQCGNAIVRPQTARGFPRQEVMQLPAAPDNSSALVKAPLAVRNRCAGPGAKPPTIAAAAPTDCVPCSRPAARPRHGGGSAPLRPQAQDAASLNSATPLTIHSSEPTNPSNMAPLFGMCPEPVKHGVGRAQQQVEAAAPIPPAMLQRWLAYRPPPGHYPGLQLSQCVPGTKFLVDSFSRVAQKSGTRSFFLTHFHYDHYMGLSKRFSAGTVYCTAETARLVQLKLKVPFCPHQCTLYWSSEAPC